MRQQRKFVCRQGPGLAGGNGECEAFELLLRTLLDEQSDLPLVHVTAEGERARDGLDGLGACSHDEDAVPQALSAARHDRVVVRLDGHQRVASQHGAPLGGEVAEIEPRHLAQRERLEDGQRTVVGMCRGREQLDLCAGGEVAQRERRLQCGDAAACDRDPLCVGCGWAHCRSEPRLSTGHLRRTRRLATLQACTRS